MDIEHELKSALRRKDASAGFTDRVMKAVEDQGLTARRYQRRGWRAVAAAGVLTAMLGGWTAHKVVQRREGEKAAAEVRVALQITSEKLHEAQEKVRQIGDNQ